MHLLSHEFNFLGQLSQFVCPDVHLTTKDAGPGDVIPAHRVVLAALSAKLFDMCKDGGYVVIRNMQFKILEEVVKFVYTGSIRMRSNEDVDNLKDALDMLRIRIEIEEKSDLIKEEVEVVEDSMGQDFVEPSVESRHNEDDNSVGMSMGNGLPQSTSSQMYIDVSDAKEVNFENSDEHGSRASKDKSPLCKKPLKGVPCVRVVTPETETEWSHVNNSARQEIQTGTQKKATKRRAADTNRHDDEESDDDAGDVLSTPRRRGAPTPNCLCCPAVPAKKVAKKKSKPALKKGRKEKK